jgi:hypothetical protein
MPVTSWNRKIFKYEIKESDQTVSDEEDKYEEFIFVHRRKLGMFLII